MFSRRMIWLDSPQKRMRGRAWRPDRRPAAVDWPEETLASRRLLYLVAATLLILAWLLGQPLLAVAGVVVGALVFVPEIWSRWGAVGLVVRRRPAAGQAMFGDEVDIVLTVENRKLLPLPWLEIRDEFPQLPLIGARSTLASAAERVVVLSVLGLSFYERARRRVRVRCAARGAYRLGPIALRWSDPFGLLTNERRLDEQAMLLVYPLVVPLERLGLPSHSPFGEQRSPVRLLDDPLRVIGVRPYIAGDEPRRIHWKATARMGDLRSKVFEPSTGHVLAIFVDMRTYERRIFGYDSILVELAVSAAASVAAWGLEQGFAVGVYANGVLAAPELDGGFGDDTSSSWSRAPELPATLGARDGTPADAAGEPAGQDGDQADGVLRFRARRTVANRLRVPPASNPAQLGRVLDGLARLQPYTSLPMERLLASEQGSLPMGATVIYVGAEAVVDVPLIVALRQLKGAGHTVTLLLTGDATSHAAPGVRAQGGPATSLAGLIAHRIGGKQRWDDLVAGILDRQRAGETDGHSDAGNKREPWGAGPANRGRAESWRTLAVD